MYEKPKLQVTKDYGLFEMHPMNRDITEKPVLLASMKAHGFMPSSPLQCVRNGTGKLKIVKGHHRFDLAKKLKLPVWYVVDSTNTDIYDLEGDSSQRWTALDFIVSRAKAGDENCIKALAFAKKHHITLGAAVGLLGGEGSDSGNQVVKAKKGTFQIASDLKHALTVVSVTDHFRSCGISFATRAALVAAVSRVLRVPECDPEVLKHRVATSPSLLQKRTNVEGYLDELEALYNHASKSRRIALAFRAREVGRQRQATFGGNAKLGHTRGGAAKRRKS